VISSGCSQRGTTESLRYGKAFWNTAGDNRAWSQCYRGEGSCVSHEAYVKRLRQCTAGWKEAR